MLVSRHMTENPVTVTPNDTLAAAQAKMESGGFRRVPVVDGGRLVGILSDRDLREHTGYLERTLVNAAMTENPLTVSSSTTIEKAAQLLLSHKIGGLPVVDNGKLAGIITTNDMLSAFLDVIGASQEGVSRIDLLLDTEPNEIAQVVEVIAEENGEILGLGTYGGEREDRRVFYVRVRTDDAARVAKALADNSYNVLAVHS
jgi:acetoin utilization protein AcuB